ncbi:MAG: hypothetical protein K8R68_10920, partial [Bacteroidales bacterium]|nr:hypothetical protein [Bacteroidales bacterium]
DVVLLFSFEPERRHKALKIVQLSIDRLYKNKMFFMGSDSEPFHLLLLVRFPLTRNTYFSLESSRYKSKQKTFSVTGRLGSWSLQWRI